MNDDPLSGAQKRGDGVYIWDRALSDKEVMRADRWLAVPEKVRTLADHDPLVHAVLCAYMGDSALTLVDALAVLVVGQADVIKRIQADTLREIQTRAGRVDL